MAEILIKNMKMPTDEDEALVLVLYENGRVRKALDFNIIALSKETTTARELQPHGRLGDLDALEKLFFERKEKARDRGDWGVADGYMYAKELVGHEPTIIEASKEGE